MWMRGQTVLAIVGALALLAAPVWAQPYRGPGGPAAQNGTGQPLSIEQAQEIAQRTLDRLGYAGLALDEIQEFSNNFYVAVKYKTGDRGAFEFLIDRYRGFVHPEPQTMMWNTQFGHMLGGVAAPGAAGYGPGGYGPGGMTGGGYGYGPGMMGGGYGYGPGMMGGGGMTGGRWTPGATPGSGPAVPPAVTAAHAKAIAQTFLNSQLPGTKVRNVDIFPGYYTIDAARDGKVVAMLSVNAYTGQVWYHVWHGTFIQEMKLH